MKRFINWLNEDTPTLAVSNKQIVWFTIGLVLGTVIKIIQSIN